MPFSHCSKSQYELKTTPQQGKIHVQETTETLLVLLLRFVLLLLLGRSGSSTTRGGSGSRGGSSVSLRVGNAVLEVLNLGPADLGLDGNGKDVLVGVDDGVHDRGQGGEVDGQGDGGNGGDGLGQGAEELLLANVENLGREGLALVVDLLDSQTVREGRDVHHVEQGGLGGTDLVAGLDELEIGGDFNGTTGNLGGDTEGLEEGRLAGLHAGVASGNPDIDGSDGTGTSRGGDTVGQKLVTDILEIAVGEDEADIALDEGQETLVLGSVVDEGLEGTADLLAANWVSKNQIASEICPQKLSRLFNGSVFVHYFQGTATYHSVLAHQDNAISTEGVADFVHLLRADIVNRDDEDGTVLLEQALELVEVAGLVSSLAPHIFLFVKAGFFRARGIYMRKGIW